MVLSSDSIVLFLEQQMTDASACKHMGNFLNIADPLLFFPSDNSAKRKQVQGFFGNKKVCAT